MTDDTEDKSLTEKAQDKAAEFKESARETLSDLSGQGGDKAAELADKTDDMKESLKENVDSAAEKLKEYCEDAGKTFGILTRLGGLKRVRKDKIFLKDLCSDTTLERTHAKNGSFNHMCSFLV